MHFAAGTHKILLWPANDAESHVVCGTRYPLPACKLTGLVRRTPRQKSRPFSMIRYDHEVVQSQVGESGWLTKQLNKRLRTLVPSTSACAPSRIGWKYTISSPAIRRAPTPAPI